jgi:pyrroline-5-carboxylate reductase
MSVGIIGAGNMGRALALGLGEPVLCADPLDGRAAALATDTGGEALGDNRELAERADLVVLAHKPGQLEDVAAELASSHTPVLSILGGRTLTDLEAALPQAPVARAMPNIAVEVGRGVVCYAPGSRVDGALDTRLRELLGRLGTVVDLEDRLMDPATGVTGVAPAYLAVIVEAWIDSAVDHGIPHDVATPMVLEAAGGAIELLRAREADTVGVRRAVTSPGGVTAAGLGALERAGIRAAFLDAMDEVMMRFGP